MNAVADLLYFFGAGVRLLALVVSAAAIFVWLTAWAARQGMIDPAGAFAAGVRRLADPVTRRVERWLLRQGGVPSAAPGWMVVLAVGGSLVAIWITSFLGSVVGSMMMAGNAGPRGLLWFVANLLFQAVFIALLIRVIGSWIGLSPYSRIGRIAGALTDWILDPLRRIIPPIGGAIDITPMIAFFLLQFAQRQLLSMLL